MPVSLKAMDYFTTALRHGNIAKAAAELNIAASAVSTAIDQVEATFDLTLVTRQRSRGIMANANGHTIARKFEALLDEYRAILTEGAELKTALTGALRIGYYAPVAPAFLPDILASFLPADADVTLHLEEADNTATQQGLLGGTFDVILFVSKDVHPAITFDVLIEAPAYCLLPADHPLAAKPQVSIAQIAREPLVVLNRPVAAAYYQGLFDAQGQQAKVAAYANATEMVRALVSANRGCAILNMRPATQTTYCGADVVARPISDPLPPLTLAVAYDKTRPRRLVQLFAQACVDYFASEKGARTIVG